MTDPSPVPTDMILAVAKRWWDQDPDGWREEGFDRPDDLRKMVGQVLRCHHEEKVARSEERLAQFRQRCTCGHLRRPEHYTDFFTEGIFCALCGCQHFTLAPAPVLTPVEDPTSGTSESNND